jgi:hypothetical protein
MILFLHWAGFSIWLGAQLTFMVWGPAAKTAKLEQWAFTWITLAKLQRLIVAPSCAVATLTGIVLTLRLVGQHADVGGATWLWMMQGFGILAAIFTLGFATPLANRMAVLALRSLEKGEKDPAAERVRARLALLGSIGGVFILVALYFGALKPATGL